MEDFSATPASTLADLTLRLEALERSAVWWKAGALVMGATQAAVLGGIIFFLTHRSPPITAGTAVFSKINASMIEAKTIRAGGVELNIPGFSVRLGTIIDAPASHPAAGLSLSAADGSSVELSVYREGSPDLTIYDGRSSEVRVSAGAAKWQFEDQAVALRADDDNPWLALGDNDGALAFFSPTYSTWKSAEKKNGAVDLQFTDGGPALVFSDNKRPRAVLGNMEIQRGGRAATVSTGVGAFTLFDKDGRVSRLLR